MNYVQGIYLCLFVYGEKTVNLLFSFISDHWKDQCPLGGEKN